MIPTRTMMIAVQRLHPCTTVTVSSAAAFSTMTRRFLASMSARSVHDHDNHSAATINPADIQLGRGIFLEQQRQQRTPLELRRVISEDEQLRNDLANCLAFTADDSEFNENYLQLFPESNELMKKQLKISRNQLRHKTNNQNQHVDAEDVPLPKTLDDAMRMKHHAVVITEAQAPFRVFDVNAAWENLCGYTYRESKGKTLGSLLSGPETNKLTTTAMIHQLLRGEQAGATLTNYTKDGRRFRNRLRCGPLLSNESNNDHQSTETPAITHFVGILQEVHDGR